MKIKIEHVGKIPVPVISTNRIRKGFNAMSYGLFVLIRPEYWDSECLILHELTHVKQFWRGWWIGYALRYRFSKYARLNYEIEAYAVELRCLPKDYKDQFTRAAATAISKKYNLDITVLEAYKILFYQVNKETFNAH